MAHKLLLSHELKYWMERRSLETPWTLRRLPAHPYRPTPSSYHSIPGCVRKAYIGDWTKDQEIHLPEFAWQSKDLYRPWGSFISRFPFLQFFCIGRIIEYSYMADRFWPGDFRCRQPVSAHQAAGASMKKIVKMKKLSNFGNHSFIPSLKNFLFQRE